ncbi:MAG TPA: SDR family oxidoreductase [Candidatus Eisenbacteria bacterium]|jgi:NAD(P)-dependent dehydrogenase (short-subunit alcohol dehydrogenase family)|nr:SDR family oxidoreductase [Candidatus Eisenbacteria bacterium]
MDADPKKIALITGANRGLGLEIARQLAKKGLCVVLTARDAAKGAEAAGTLKKEGFDVHFQPMDVTDRESVVRAREFVEKKFGRLDVLINNAGVFLDKKTRGLDVDPATVRTTFEVNALGALSASQVFVPLMLKNGYGRIVNLSSGLGTMEGMQGGYPGYRLSKAALNAMTLILAAELKGTNVLVNSMCPGWCRTDMGGPEADRTPEQGADTAVWLSTLPDKGPSGKYFRDRRPIDW